MEGFSVGRSDGTVRFWDFATETYQFALELSKNGSKFNILNLILAELCFPIGSGSKQR